MAEVLLFHHVLGQTWGFLVFAEELRRAGHTVHTPDLYEGRVFATMDEGMAHAKGIGFRQIIERGVRAADALPAMDADPIFVGERDIDAARALVASTPRAELFLYPGAEHYFADSSLPSYDAGATALLMRRVLEFLRSTESRGQ